MDIIDIILARALTPQGQVNTYAAKAQKAAQDAAAAATSAQSVADNMESISNQITTTGAAAQQAVVDANTALATVNEALATLDEGTISYEDIDAEIKNLMISGTGDATNSAYNVGLNILYPDGDEENVEELVVMHKQPGDSQTATMTQGAIKAYIESVKAELEQKIATHGGSEGGDTPTPQPSAEGEIVFYDENGQVITDQSVIDQLIRAGAFKIRNAFGSEVDYVNKMVTRINDADHPIFDINYYKIYTGRMRCNVANNGTITAWYGDANYRDDGSNGQVMVYQPKFYYKRVPINTVNNTIGKIIKKETLLISPYAGEGFKLHPLFYGEDGVTELDYVLISAYEGSVYDVSTEQYITNDASNFTAAEDQLSSIAGVKPVSGVGNKLNSIIAERLAKNRGTGWHITNMACESANQMLQALEYNSFNGQDNIEKGISDFGITYNAKNYSSYTGSTSALGNLSGAAESTINERDGIETIETTPGKRAVSYRGMENPWGNLWRYIGGAIVNGNGSQKGGQVYLAKNFNYSDTLNDNYVGTECLFANTNGWSSSFAYGNSAYDWVFIPAEANGNSTAPIGDGLWITGDLNREVALSIGGKCNMGDQNGLFYYAADRNVTEGVGTHGARLMYIPTKNAIYNANLASWRSKTGG